MGGLSENHCRQKDDSRRITKARDSRALSEGEKEAESEAGPDLQGSCWETSCYVIGNVENYRQVLRGDLCTKICVLKNALIVCVCIHIPRLKEL